MKTVAVLLMVLLVYQPVSAIAQTQSDIKAQLDKIPIGKNIEVRLLREDDNKIKGKLVSVANDSFEVQTMKSGKTSNETIAFTDVKSVKKSAAKTPVWVIVGLIAAGAGIGLYTISKTVQ